MPADATLILDAVKSVLTGLYPGVPVYVGKRPAAGGRQMQGGWQQGYALPCFVLTAGEPEEVDRVPSFTHLTVGYPVLVEYCKAAQAAVPGATGAATAAEDPDVRDTRAAVRAALYRPKLAGAPAVFDVQHRTRRPYEAPAGAEATVLVGGQLFTYTTSEPRPR